MKQRELSVKEVSEITGKDPETIRRNIREGNLKADRKSRKTGYRIDYKDLLDSRLVPENYGKEANVYVVLSISIGYRLNIIFDIYGVYTNLKEAKFLSQRLRMNNENKTFIVKKYQLEEFEIDNLKRMFDFCDGVKEVSKNED